MMSDKKHYENITDLVGVPANMQIEHSEGRFIDEFKEKDGYSLKFNFINKDRSEIVGAITLDINSYYGDKPRHVSMKAYLTDENENRKFDNANIPLKLIAGTNNKTISSDEVTINTLKGVRGKEEGVSFILDLMDENSFNESRMSNIFSKLVDSKLFSSETSEKLQNSIKTAMTIEISKPNLLDSGEQSRGIK